MFTDPAHNVAQFQIMPGQHVADLGAGSGFYVIEAAKAVGEAGHVYAVDVQKELLPRIKANAEKEHLHNISVIWGNLETLGGTHIPSGSIDAVIVSNVLFQIEDRDGFVSEIKRIIKPSGRVLVVEWEESEKGAGPLPHMVVKKEDARSLFMTAGFVHERDISAGTHHYGFILRMKGN